MAQQVMLVTDADFLAKIESTLARTEAAIAAANKRADDAEKIADANRLLNEAEAMDYLRRDSDTLQYYRRFGLNSYKQGRDRWYRKGDIDAWLESGKVNRRLD